MNRTTPLPTTLITYLVLQYAEKSTTHFSATQLYPTQVICRTQPLSLFWLFLPRPEFAGISTLLTATQLLSQTYNTKTSDVNIYLLVCYIALLIINLNIVLTTDIPFSMLPSTPTNMAYMAVHASTDKFTSLSAA